MDLVTILQINKLSRLEIFELKNIVFIYKNLTKMHLEKNQKTTCKIK